MAETLTMVETAADFAACLLPLDPYLETASPERRIIVEGVSWQRFLELQRRREKVEGEGRAYFFNQVVEIMTTSGEHERIKIWLGDFVAFYLEHLGIDADATGQATLQSDERHAAAEPDHSWHFGACKSVPDLVLEVALSSGGIEKLAIYARLKVPEVWIWRDGTLQIFGLSADGARYDRWAASKALPGFDPQLACDCLALPSWTAARRAFRQALK